MAIVTLEFVKDYLEITNTAYDVKITALIPSVEQNYLDLRNVPFKEVDGVIEYPVGSDVTASEMIGFKLINTKFGKSSFGTPAQSESIDSYSISYGDVLSGGVGGYPKSISSQIKRYCDGR